MEAITITVRLLWVVFTLLAAHGQESDAAFLHISPARLQFFEYESISFLCDGFDRPVRLITPRNNKIFSPKCVKDEMLMSVNCTIYNVLQPDSGGYWCEADGGQKSNKLNISITGGSVILDIPVFPVEEGENVTLCCKQRDKLTIRGADFFKDGQKIQTDYKGRMTIDRVSKSDEGLYKCDISALGESPENWLAVTDKKTNTNTKTNSHNKEERHQDTQIILLFRTVFISVAVALMTVLVGLLHCGIIGKEKKKDRKQTRETI